VQGFGESEAVNTLARIVQEGKEEDFSPNPKGLTLPAA
jgi:hypothetical protein